MHCKRNITKFFLYSLMFLISSPALLHVCTAYIFTFYYATGDTLTKTTRLSQPQNKQVTVEEMQLLYIKM